MRKKLLALGILVISLTLATPAFAAGLSVTSIGSLDTTTGTFYNAWWYTQENPTLSGTAESSATVTVDIDGITDTTTADTLGNWSYAPTTLTTGSHTVILTSGTETLNFSLEIGSDTGTTTVASPTPTSTATTPATLPDSGVGSYTVFMALGALVAVGFGAYTFAFAKEN